MLYGRLAVVPLGLTDKFLSIPVSYGRPMVATTRQMLYIINIVSTLRNRLITNISNALFQLFETFCGFLT